MGAHIIEGEFQSDKYPTTPRGKVPLSVKDPTAQDLLWLYAQRRRIVDAEFAADLESVLIAAGYKPPVVDVPRCDRCTRPATQQVKAGHFRREGDSGKFCGRHAAKSGFPCGALVR